MEWTRKTTIGLAKTSCAQCHGLGMRFIRQGKETPCNCVFRAIFRACYRRFREYAEQEKTITTVTLEYCPGRNGGKRYYSRKTEEFLADFVLLSRRALDEEEYRAFRFHFLLGADWRLCCRQMNLDRGTFFHLIYRVEQKLGKAFALTEPYALYPVDEYFGGTVRKEPELAEFIDERPRRGIRWQVPLARPA
jgi:hypothetical protein